MVERVLQLNREKHMFWTLISILFLSFAFYIYCINITVHNTVARQNFENESSKLTLSISNEEFQYIKKRNEITLQKAYSMGFRDVSVKTFITDKNVSQVSYVPPELR